MNSNEAYKQKLGAELKQVQAKLAEIEIPQKSLTADARIKYDKQINNLKTES